MNIAGLGKLKSSLWTWFKTWLWNDMDPGCHHLAESFLFNIPCESDKSVSEISFWRRLIWKLMGLQEPLLWNLQPSQHPLGLEEGFLDTRKEQAGMRLPVRQGIWVPFWRLRKVQEGNTGNTRSFYPLHVTWLNKCSFLPGTSFWAISHENYDHGSQE